MVTVPLYELLKKRVLVTRESAQMLRPSLRDAETSQGQIEIELDFDRVEAVTPSFVDEILGLILESVEASASKQLRLRLTRTPTRLTSKFLAIARARGVAITEESEGTWLVQSPG
jgi:hypothetical protein